MAILKSLPTSAKINGESVQGNLLKIKSSVIRVDKILKKDFQKEKKDVELTRRRAEKIFRKKLENRVEQKDKLDKVAPEKISVPGLSFLDSFKSFVSKVVLGFFAIKLLPLLPKLIPVAIGLGKFVNFIINVGGRLLNGIISFVDFGFRAGEATNGFIKQIGGEKTAEIFSKFGGAITGLIDAALLIGLLSLNESGQDFMFDQKNRKPKGPKGGGPLKGIKRSLKRTSLKSFGKTGTKNLAKFGKGLKNFGPLKIIFTVLDFTGRRSQGQSILQSVLGSGGGLAGFSAGAKAGAALGTLVAPGVGSLIGGFIGGMIGASLGAGIADKITGANKIQGRNEGGLVKGKGQDRFKSKEDSLSLSRKISGIEFDQSAKQVFPNNVLEMPQSGEYISGAFKDITQKPNVYGPITGLSYKMLTGQSMSNTEFKIASDNLKAASKFGFSTESLRKYFTQNSSKISRMRVDAVSNPEEEPKIPAFVRAIGTLGRLFGIDTTPDPDGQRINASLKELRVLRMVSAIAVSVAAAIAIAIVAAGIVGIIAFFNPALAAFISKLVASMPKLLGLKGLIPKGFGKILVTKSGGKVDVAKFRTAREIIKKSSPRKGIENPLDITGFSKRKVVKRLNESQKQSLFSRRSSGQLDFGGIKDTKQLELSRKILDPKGYAARIKNLKGGGGSGSSRTADINEALKKFDAGDDLLRSVEGDPKVLGARSLVERETGSIIRKFKEVQPPPGSTLTRSEIGQAAESSNVLEKIIEILKRKGAMDPNAATNVNPITKTLRKGGGLSGNQVPENLSTSGTKFFEPPKFNTGGLVKGAGGIDNISAMLSPNEFVLDFDTTSALRSNYPGFLSALNKASDKEDIINILQNYASYESGIGGGSKVIYIDAPVTKEINIASDTSSGVVAPSSKPRSNPFRRLARVG